MKFQDALAYQKSFALAMRICGISKRFPMEGKFSLTGQRRRCSGSVCANRAECYGKRKYPKHFLNKLTDCDSDNLKTQPWLEFALACTYIDKDIVEELMELNRQTGALIYFMLNHPDKFGSK